MAVEIELKWKATPAQQEKILADWEYFGTAEMVTTYFDTPQLTLRQEKCTLRARLENGICVCTLKTPAPGIARGEWEVEDAALEEALPVLQEKSGKVLPPFDRLQPLCGAKFTRRMRLISYPGGEAELAVDAGVLTGGGREIPLCEVELELKHGSAEALETFAAVFARQYSLQQETRSKFRRASALALGE